VTTPEKRGLTGPPSPRQSEVLLLVGQGLTNDEIAKALGIGSRTVKQHVTKLCSKLGVRRKRELIPIAQRLAREGELA